LPSDALISLAETAATLAGFSGLVVAFRSRGSSEWHPQEAVLLFTMVNSGLAAFLLALVPHILVGLGGSPGFVVRASSMVAGTSIVLAFTWPIYLSVWRLPRRGYRNPRPMLVAGYIVVLAAVALWLFASGIVGFASWPAYLSGILVLLSWVFLGLAMSVYGQLRKSLHAAE
jgi:hypothetical protein